jgi:hypothetical protein
MENEIMNQQGLQEQVIDKVSDDGRGGDTTLGHLTMGEIVIPVPLQTPELLQALQQLFAQNELTLEQYTVGNESNSINPESGLPEFGFFKKIFKSPIFKIAAPIALSLLAPGLGTAIGGSLLGAGAAGSATLGGALLGAGTGALTGGGLKGSLLGGLTGGIAPNLSSIGTSLKNTASGALDSFGKATGLSDVFTSASGALSDIGGNLANGVNDAYNGSLLQDATNGISSGVSSVKDSIGNTLSDTYKGSGLQSAFNSGADALKSIGIGTGSEGLTAGTGAISGGGGSSFSPAEQSFLSKATANLSSSGGSSMNFLSPIGSALLGTNANNKTQKALLAQQEANRALFEPYLNFDFKPTDLQNDPGYQFNLEQGNQALDRTQLARGGYFSGEALKEAQKFGQGLADTTYNDAYSRALQKQTAGLQGAAATAGVNENIGNIKANSITNKNNLYSGALSGLLGGSGYDNTGKLQGALDIQDLLRRYGIGA